LFNAERMCSATAPPIASELAIVVAFTVTEIVITGGAWLKVTVGPCAWMVIGAVAAPAIDGAASAPAVAHRR
jgi:hypothetical protein